MAHIFPCNELSVAGAHRGALGAQLQKSCHRSQRVVSGGEVLSRFVWGRCHPKGKQAGQGRP